MSLITTANTVQESLIVILDLFGRGMRSVLVKNTGASKSQFDKLNKELRTHYYVTRHTDGFVVHNTKKPE